MARICMVGSWHQAMVYGAGLADIGHRVVGVCDSAQTADQLNQGKPVVYEPGLAELMAKNIRRKRLSYTTDYRAALKSAEFAYLAVDTRVLDDDSSDLDPLYEIASSIGRHASGGLTLCVSSQVPVGSCEQLLAKATAVGRHRMSVAYVPEFLRLGSALETFKRADRVVVGSDDLKVARRVGSLYAKLRRPIMLTDLRTAEMAKHASNTFLATSISFINEVANLCDRVGADATEVARILKADRRIGPHAFLEPGLGFAGGTLGREIKALQRIGVEVGVRTPIMDAVLAVNATRPRVVTDRLDEMLGGLAGKQIAMLGLTYKARTSTLRRALSLEIIQQLNERRASVAAFDPLAVVDGVSDLPYFLRRNSPYLAAERSDAVVFMTEWVGIERLSLTRLRRRMAGRLFFDTKNYFDPAKIAAAGFDYVGVGRSRTPGMPARGR